MAALLIISIPSIIYFISTMECENGKYRPYTLDQNITVPWHFMIMGIMELWLKSLCRHVIPLIPEYIVL